MKKLTFAAQGRSAARFDARQEPTFWALMGKYSGEFWDNYGDKPTSLFKTRSQADEYLQTLYHPESWHIVRVTVEPVQAKKRKGR